jgi:ribulose kinase
VAAGKYVTVVDAMKNMSRIGKMIEPDFRHRKHHDRKYKIFKLMYEQFEEIRELSKEL